MSGSQHFPLKRSKDPYVRVTEKIHMCKVHSDSPGQRSTPLQMILISESFKTFDYMTINIKITTLSTYKV